MKIQSVMIISIIHTVFFGNFISANQVLSNKDLARSEWIKGFHKIEEAEYSEEFGNYQKALDLFNDAKRIFQRVQNRYNKWNQSLLNFRINYCEQKISKIEKLSGLTSEDIEVISSLTKQKTGLYTKNQTLEKRSEDLEGKNLKLEKEIEELTKKLDNSKSLQESSTKTLVLEKELNRLKRQINESEMIKAQLEIKASDFEREIARLRSEQEKSIVKIAEKDRDYELLKIKLTEFESKFSNKEKLSETKQRRIQELTRQVEGAKKIQAKLDKSILDLKKTQDSKAALTQKLKVLRTRLEEESKQVELVENELQGKNEETFKMQALIQTEKTQKESYLGQIDKFQLEITQLTNTNLQLNKEISKLKDQENLYRVRIENLHKTFRAKQDELTKLRELEDHKLIEQERINKELAEIQHELAGAKKSISLFQNTIQKHKEETEGHQIIESGLRNEVSVLTTKLLETKESQEILRKNYDSVVISNRTLESRINTLLKQSTLIEEMKEGISTINDQIGRAEKIRKEFEGIGLQEEIITPQKWETSDQVMTSSEILELSKQFIESGNFDDAEKLLLGSIHQDPNAPELISKIGSLFIKTNRNVSAISILSKALSAFPNNPEILRLLGLAYLRVGKLELAEIQLKRSFGLQKANAETALTLALLYAETEPLQIENVKEWYKLARSLGCPVDPNLDDLVKEYSSRDYLSKSGNLNPPKSK